MAASIDPTSTGAQLYTITSSQRAQVELEFHLDFAQTFAFSVTYPTTAGAQVSLATPAHPAFKDLLPGPLNGDTTFANRSLTTSTSVVAGDTTLDVSITITGNPSTAVAEKWTVRLSAPGATLWKFAQLDNDPFNLVVPLLMCDPVAQISGVVPAIPQEKSGVTLSAAPAIGLGTVVGTAPAVHYRWTYAGNIVVGGFPEITTVPTKTFVAPGVYGDATITAKLDTWLDESSVAPGFLTSATSQVLTIKPRTQHLMVVLDRSGSMASGSRWENAVTATRIVCQLFSALREQVVATNDRIGVLVFEDSTCSWRMFSASAFAPDPLIALNLAFSVAEGDLGRGICQHDFGNPGSCTPIGDALVKAMLELSTLPSADGPRYNIVLLTDGYENSGTVYLRPSSPAAVAAGAQAFSAVRGTVVSGTNLAPVNADLSIWPIGLGTTVDDEVLNQLAWASTGLPTVYRNVTDASQLSDAFAQMVSFSQDAQAVASAQAPFSPMPNDPAPPANARYFIADAQANRMALAVEWSTSMNAVELALYNENTSTYDVFVTNPAICAKHGFTSVNLADQYGGEANVPATYWRVVHKSNGVAQAIADNDFLVYVDLHVKADIAFDKREYRTGDTMVLSARIQAGPDPVKDARVFVELARPGESLGTFLATNSGLYKPDGPPQGPDPAAPKQAMLMQLLQAKKLGGLTVSGPPAIFADGSNELFDDGAHQDGRANDGLYANVFQKIDKEGTYTWRFFVTGKLPDGSPFTRLMTLSTWAGIRVDPLVSPVSVAPAAGAPQGVTAVQVSVIPKDAHGEYLGPFRESDVRFQASAGSLQGGVVSHPDGSYSQVLWYRPGEDPVVTVVVQGTPFPPVPVVPGKTTRCRWLCEALVRLLEGLLRCVRACCKAKDGPR